MNHSSSRAFTLIELLIVLVIIAILIAIAAPSFLNQQSKAQNSAAYQELAVAYKDAKSDMASNLTGGFPSYTTLAADIASDEPQYSVGTAVYSSDAIISTGPYLKVWVLSGGTGTPTTSGNNLFLADVSKSGQVCTLSVTGDGPPVYNGCGNTGGGTAGTSAAAATAPAVTAAPVISSSTGSSVVGETLTETSNGSWNPTPTAYSYQWEDCSGSGMNCTPITGATGTSYIVASTDVGQSVYLKVTAFNGSSSSSALDGSGSGVVTTPIAGLFTFESSLQGWYAGGNASYAGSTAAQTTVQAHTGNGSALVTTNGNSYYQGIQYDLSTSSFVVGQPYTAGVWVKGVSGADLELFLGSFNSSGFDLKGVDWTANGSWQYETVTWTPAATAGDPIFCLRTGATPVATTFYFDDAFVKAGSS